MTQPLPQRWIYASAVAGACCIAAPWVDWRSPRSLPGTFDARSVTAAMIVAKAAEVDAACAGVDAAALRACTTARYFAELDALLAQSSRRFDADAPAAQRTLLGDLRSLRLLQGTTAPLRDGRSLAVAVYARPRSGFEHQSQAAALLGLRWVWDGYDLRFDGKQSRALQVGELESAAARELTRSMLQPVH